MKRSLSRAKILAPSELAAWRKKRKGKKIVFTAGSFDLLHVGHLRYLAKAKTLGDLLVVGVPSNEAVRRLKGPGRPLIDERARALSLSYLEPVDAVVIFKEATVAATLLRLQPDVFFTVDEAWNRGLRESPEYRIVKSYGGEVVVSARQSPFVSASALIRKIAGLEVKEVFRECLEALSEGKNFSEDLEKIQLKMKL